MTHPARLLVVALLLVVASSAFAQVNWHATGLYTGNFIAVAQCSGFYMASTGPNVYRSTDGITWTDVSAQFGGNQVYCFVTWTQVLTSYTGAGTSAGFYKTLDNGLTWTQGTVMPTNISVWALNSPGGGRLLAGTSDGIYYSGSYDMYWAKITTLPAVTNCYSFTTYTISGNTSVYAGTNAGVYRAPSPGINYGATWVDFNDANTTGKTVKSVMASGSNILAAVWNGATGLGLYKSGYSAAAWTTANTGLTNLNVNSLGVPTTPLGTLYAATDDGIYQSTNGATSWTDYSAGLPSRVVKFVGMGLSSALCAPQGGGVYRQGAVFLPPVLTSPANAATNVTVPTTCTWTYPVGTPSYYELVYSTSSTFASNNVTVSNIPTTTTDLAALHASSLYYWHVRAFVDGAWSPYSTTFSFTTNNFPEAPTTPTTLTLTPASPFTTDTLTANASGSIDYNPGDVVTYLYQWRVSNNGGASYGAWGPRAGNTVLPADTVRGQKWQCRASATDGTLTSAPFVSPTTLTIQNSAPTAPTSITFAPAAPTTDDNIVPTAAGATDADGDAVTYQYEWNVSFDGGATWSGWVFANPILPYTATETGDQWKCHARAFDGYAYSATWYESPTILTIAGPVPPAVVSATYVDTTHVDVLYSKLMQQASVETLVNYNVPGLVLSGAALQVDGMTVRLTTAVQPESTTYTVTVTGVLDAFGNAIGASNTAQWTTPGVPPTVVSATYVDTTHVNVLFSEAVQLASAQTAANYAVAPALAVSGAVLQPDGMTVQLTTAVQPENTNYTVTVTGVLDLPGNAIAASNTGTWTTPGVPPTVVSATYVDTTHVDVLFSEAVQATSAQTAANYSVAPALLVNGAVLQPDNMTVRLTTDVQPELTTYTVTVTGVLDLPGNAIAASNTGTWTTPGLLPTVVSATYIDTTTVDVLFSKTMQQLSAETVGNYAIAPALTISAAVLQVDGKTVRLTTAVQPESTSYTVTVTGVQDTLGNTIGPNNTGTWTTPGVPPSLVSVTFVDPTHVDALFSEAIQQIPAETVANYSVPYLTVSGAVLQPDGLTVRVTTGPQASLRTYTLFAKNIPDLLGNIPPRAVSAAWTTPDYPPSLVSVTFVDLTHVKALFNEAVQQIPAETVANYSVPYLSVTGAVLQPDAKTVALTTTTQTANRAYTLFAKNVPDLLGNVPARATTAPWTATVATLTVVSATGVDATHVDVLFSMPVDPVSAQTVANYGIPYLTVAAAAVQPDGKTVRLTTNVQASSRTYTVTVSGVLNLTAQPVQPPRSASWTTPANTLAVTSATYVDVTHVDVLFNGAVDKASAETLANYSIPYMTVSGAALQLDNVTVRLTIGTQVASRTYTLYVRGVKNAAGYALAATNKTQWTTPALLGLVVAGAVTHDFPAGTWLVSVPTLAVPGDAARALGTAQVAQWDATAQTTRPYADAAFSLQCGRGYWVNLARPQTLTVPGRPLAGPVNVAVVPGWNLLGNPFAEPMRWSQVAGRGLLAPCGWRQNADGSGLEMVSDLQGLAAAHEVAPWQGLWVWSNGSGEVILKDVAPADAAAASATSPADWSAQLTAAAGDVVDRSNYIGQAKTGLSLQAANPPAMGARYVDLYTLDATGRRCAVDLKDVNGKASWDLVVETNIPRATVKVQYPDLSAVPSSLALVLRDLDTGRAINMRTTGSYTFSLSADATSRRLRLEAAPRMSQPLVVTGLAAQSQADSVGISYCMSTAANVEITVRNIAGRTVAVIPVGFQSAGTHTATWSRRGLSGTRVPAGRYLMSIRCAADDGTQVEQVAPATVR